ncbi:MAG: hypothetical protein KF800_02525 [Lysobacter sp.]|nr:hypothetical protein [Lysobacter sp.]
MTTATQQAVVDVADPRWFPVDLDPVTPRVAMLRIDEGHVTGPAFMDNRLGVDFSAAVAVPLQALHALPAPPRAAWLFHTSFCCSTLLARALQDTPACMVYREPLVLRRLSDARDRGMAIAPWMVPTTRLLFRPWRDDGVVVVKPTHAALNIAADLLAATPGSRAVALLSSLDDFLVSNIKKTPETHAKVPALVERAVAAGSLRQRLAGREIEPPSLLAAVALQWVAQRELLVDIDARAPGRLRFIDASQVLADLAAAARDCLEWWGLPADMDALRDRAAAVAAVNAKQTSATYSARQREDEAAQLARMFARELAEARAWFECEILPAIRPQALALGAG